MPYASTPELPASVKSAIPAQVGQRLFMHVVNGMLERGKSDSEAFAAAWSALQRAGYEKKDGKWTKVDKTTETKDLKIVAKTLNSDKRLVWAWASVATVKGQPLVDYHGDIVEIDELQRAAHEYMVKSRDAKYNHSGRVRGTVVESMVFTKELQDALGIDLEKEGWLVCMFIQDDILWEKIKSGEVAELSIGGAGEYEYLEDEDEEHEAKETPEEEAAEHAEEEDDD